MINAKRVKFLMLLSFVWTTHVQAMDETEATSLPPKASSSPPSGEAQAFDSHGTNRISFEPTQEKLSFVTIAQCTPWDPRCGYSTPVVKISHKVACAHPSSSSPSQPFKTGELDEEVRVFLQNFGLSSETSEEIWKTFVQITTDKQSEPFSLVVENPYLIASSLWRAHQERLSQDDESKQVLPLKTILSCLLTDTCFLNGKKQTGSPNAPKTPLRKEDLQRVVGLAKSNPYFRKLDIFGWGLPSGYLPEVASILHLKVLSLEENCLGDENLNVLVAHPELDKLNLSRNKISAQGAKVIAQSPRLREVSLAHNATGDEGAAAFVPNTVLLSLDLRDTGMGDRGAQALGERNKTLTALRLRYNNLTDKGALAFLRSTQLTHLELDRNQVSPDVAHFVQHVMPSHSYLTLYHKLPGNLPPPTLPQKDKIRIFSIDGGGIRGLMPALVLQHISDHIGKKIGAPFHFAQHVDLMAGTSTGGLIGFGLTMPGENGRPKYAPDTLVDLYSTKGPTIFPGPWAFLKVLVESRYDPRALETCLEELFGDTPLSATTSHTLITSFDLVRNQAHVFDSYAARQDPSHDFTIRGAARATSAAPTYFPSAKIKNRVGQDFNFVDGRDLCQ